jgi:hypothetical protein
MKRNGDVMRSDRLKQVMQEIDASFDERNLGIAKFSRFCQEAAQRGLLSITKLDNGQLEVDIPAVSTPPTETRTLRPEPPAAETAEPPTDERSRRGRRGRGGRGRDREDRPPREPRAPAASVVEPEIIASAAPPIAPPAVEIAPVELITDARATSPDGQIGVAGERLTRAEAFDLVRRTVADLTRDDEAVRASEVRHRARQLLGRDSESLSDRMFVRILKDAHDEGLIDLRRRGDDFEVARASEAAPVAEQLARADRAAAPAAAPSQPQTSTAPRFGMGPRGAGPRVRGRPGAPPPELLSIGVVEDVPPIIDVGRPAAPTVAANGAAVAPAETPKRGRGTRSRGKKTGGGRATPTSPAVVVDAKHEAPAAEQAPAGASRRGSRGGAKRGGAKRAKKSAGPTER